MASSLSGWLRVASPKEREQLARIAKTTVGRLWQLAGSYRSGSPKAGVAIRIDRGTHKLRQVNTALPLVRREDVCADCKSCEFAKLAREAGL